MGLQTHCPLSRRSLSALCDPGESEEEEEAKITLLQRKRNQLAGYCKLVIYSVLDLIAATDIFKYYCKVGRVGR